MFAFFLLSANTGMLHVLISDYSLHVYRQFVHVFNHQSDPITKNHILYTLHALIFLTNARFKTASLPIQSQDIVRLLPAVATLAAPTI